MTKVSIVMVTLAGLGGVAMAQKAGSAPASKADAKSGAEWGKAPAEIAAMAKHMAGTWRCKGQGVGPDMKMTDMTGTMRAGKLDMENWWIHDTFDSTMAKSKYHFDSYTTFDPTTKKWHRVMIETGGGYSQGDSSGMEGGKLDWELTARGPMGEALFRDHLDASDPKTGVKVWGEASMDKGKSWTKVYEMSCKK
jgi:hypothetical protein